MEGLTVAKSWGSFSLKTRLLAWIPRLVKFTRRQRMLPQDRNPTDRTTQRAPLFNPQNYARGHLVKLEA